MKKKLIAVFVMLTMTMALMPVTFVHADGTVTKTITLTEETKNTQIVVAANENVTLDLAGIDLSVTDKSAIVNNGTLTIIDSGKKNTDGTMKYGSVTVSSTYTYTHTTADTGHVEHAAVFAKSGSTTYIHAGTYKSPYWYTVKNLETMYIDNATFTKADDTVSAAVVVNGWYGASDLIDGEYYPSSASTVAHMTINSGTFTGNGGAVTLGNGYASTQAIKNDNYGVMTINGGTFTGTRYTFYNANVATINGGTFTGSKGGLYNGGDTTGGQDGKLTVNGGSFTSTGADSATVNALLFTTVSKISIYGGTFTGVVGVASGSTSDSNTTVAVYDGTFKTSDGSANTAISTYLANGASYDSTTKKVVGTAIAEITKYVLFESTPNNTKFTYSISNTTGSDGALIQDSSSTDNYERVYDGKNAGSVTVTSTEGTDKEVDFNIDDFNAGKAANTLMDIGVATTDQHLYTAKSIIVDFTKVVFDAPGVYRYKMIETSDNEYLASSATEAAPLYFDVWVERKSGTPGTDDYGNFKVAGVIAHTSNTLTVTNKTVSTKTSYLESISKQASLNLTVKHSANGNQASKIESFKYEVDLTGGTPNSNVIYTLSTGESGTIQLDNTGAAAKTFDLTDGDSFVIKHIGQGTGYTAKATDAAQTKMTSLGVTTGAYIEDIAADILSDRKTNDKGNATAIGTTTDIKSLKTSEYSITDSYLNSDTIVDFKIYKQGTIPTGIILNVAPYAAVLLAGAFGLIIFVMKKRDHEEEDA